MRPPFIIYNSCLLFYKLHLFPTLDDEGAILAGNALLDIILGKQQCSQVIDGERWLAGNVLPKIGRCLVKADDSAVIYIFCSGGNNDVFAAHTLYFKTFFNFHIAVLFLIIIFCGKWPAVCA